MEHHLAKVKAIKFCKSGPYLWLKIVLDGKKDLESLKECIARLEDDSKSDHIHIQARTPKGLINQAAEVIVENEERRNAMASKDELELDEELVIEWPRLMQLLQSENP